MTEYQENLVVLAVALGFQTIEKDGKVYLTTIYNNKTMLYPIEQNSGNALLGKEKEILEIIDSRYQNRKWWFKKKIQTFYVSNGRPKQ